MHRGIRWRCRVNTEELNKLVIVATVFPATHADSAHHEDLAEGGVIEHLDAVWLGGKRRQDCGKLDISWNGVDHPGDERTAGIRIEIRRLCESIRHQPESKVACETYAAMV